MLILGSCFYQEYENNVHSICKWYDGPLVIVQQRSNYDVYICLFVNIEIKTLGWHIQQSGVVLVRIPSMLSFLFLHFYCFIFSHASFKHNWKTVLTVLQSVHQMGHYQTQKRIYEVPLNAF